MKKRILIFIAFLAFISADAQMYPWFTQYRSNMFTYNPGFCGTKRFLDVRLFYRNQWTGFAGAPKTYGATLAMRLANEKVGLGLSFFNDEIGPFKNTQGAFTFAYHLKFDDVELSAGIQANYMQQTFNGTKVTLHNQIDRGINQYVSDTQKMYDGGFGLVLLNDRFYFGLSANNFIGNQMIHYSGDPFYKGKYQNATSYCVGAGFNYADNPDYTFENSVMALYTAGVPFYFDYTLRLHIQKVLLTGISIRLQDAIAVHLGFNVKNQFQIAYSYDIITSPLKKYSGGSHEIGIVFSSNLGRDQKKKGFNNRFLRQKFQYLL